jgi:hypothetical protein
VKVMRERKNNLITIRMDDKDKETLEYLSEHMNRSITDTIMRACKFFSSSGCGMDNDENSSERARKNNYVHMRVSDSDKDFLDVRCCETKDSMSKYVRKSLKAYYDSVKGI